MRALTDALADRHVLVRKLLSDRLIRNSAIYLTGSVMAGLLGYVFHFATGRMLGPAGYAVVASVLAALYIVSLPSLVVQFVSARFVSLAIGRGEAGSINRLLLRITVACLAIGAVVALALVLLAPWVAGYLQLAQVQLVYVLAATSAVALLVCVNRGALQGMQRFVALSANTVLDLGTRVVVAVGLIGVGLGAFGGLLALLAGPVVAYLQGLRLVRVPEQGRAAAVPSLGEVGRYALTAFVAAGGVTYMFNADVLLAKHYLTPASAGVYAAGSVLARVVYFLGTTVAGAMFPQVTTLHARDGGHLQVVDRALLLLGLIAVSLAAAYFVVPGLVLLPYGHGYDPVRPYLGEFAVALGLLSIANLLVNYFLSINSVRFVAPVIAACVLETALIAEFHAGVGQVVTMLLLSMLAFAAVMAGLYLADRLRPAASRSDVADAHPAGLDPRPRHLDRAAELEES